MTIPGIDASNHQYVISWPDVAASGIQFALVKASESVDYTDPYFAGNWASLKQHNILRGAYHFARPSRNTPEAEADFFLSVVGQLEQGDVVALDMEDEQVGAGVDLSVWTLAWLKRVEAVVGCKPLLYSGYWYLQPHADLTPELAQYGLWYASYQATEPPVPGSWQFIAVWQHDDHGQVPGVTGDCDLDTFNGTREQFQAYGAPPPPDPCAAVTARLVSMTAERDRLVASIVTAKASIAGALGALG